METRIFKNAARLLCLLSTGIILLASSCGKKNEPEKPPYPILIDRTDHPVEGFFKVTKVEPSLLGREAKHSDGATWRLDEDYLRWNLIIPTEEITCSLEKNPQDYQRLCKEYGVRDDIRYISPEPIVKFWLVNGLHSLKLVYEEIQTKSRQDLSAQATLDYRTGLEQKFANARYAGQEIRFPESTGILRSTLEKLPAIAFQWGFWNVGRFTSPYLLVFQKKGLDISGGRLLLIFEREGDTPLEVELPQS